MGLFGNKRKNEPAVVAAEPQPVISDRDLASAEQIMNQWDASMGNSDEMWDCIEAVAKRGGFTRSEAWLLAADIGKEMDRPWRWWNEAARAAHAGGQHALTGRIFLFSYFFVNQLSPKMSAGNEMDTGLARPKDHTYKDIATLAVDSLSKLSAHLLIHDTATGQVDVGHALQLAEDVSGVAAHPSAMDGPISPPPASGGNEWNTL